MNAPVLAPAAALCVWSLVVLFWMAGTRFPAMFKAGMTLDKLPPGGRGQNLEGVLPDKINWKAHNFTHLMEQPTVFYPIVIILALTQATTVDVTLAWAYVALRVAHSIWQCTVNTIGVRGPLFMIMSLVLFVLGIRAFIAAI